MAATLVPNEQIVVTYLYVSPTTFNQINSYTKCDHGYAHVVTALTAPIQKPWVKGAITGLATYGAIMLLSAIWQGASWLFQHYIGS